MFGTSQDLVLVGALGPGCCRLRASWPTASSPGSPDGVTELWATPFPVGSDVRAGTQRTRALLADLAPDLSPDEA